MTLDFEKAKTMTVRQILVPIDFSESSAAALDHACELAKQFSAKLFLLHVSPGTPPSEVEEQDRVRIGLEKLNAAISANAELALQTNKEVISGSPHRVIPKYAEDKNIDLIVMGTHGRTGFAHFTLGSVAGRVLRTAPCPVLVSRANDVNASNTRAIESLATQFGETLQGTHSATKKQLSVHLQDTLNISPTVANRELEQLQERQWIRWQEKHGDESGQWTIIPPAEFHDEVDSSPAEISRSPALDLIERARRLRATDIHIDPTNAGDSSVRLRIDGRLEPYCQLDQDVAEHLVNRLKMLARLDIAEPFRPKEGRLSLPSSMSEMEVRITTAPVAAGEAVALRLFAREKIFFPLDQLGLSLQSRQCVETMLQRGEGLVLVTGPTGGGKSTTVYSMLQCLPGVDQNIVSIEDPVEFAVPFVRQLSVDLKHEISMTTGLRTILRMDPDVIFVGEIRDAPAAEIAMRAASSGKYVLSTLHTRNVASTVTALRDLGIADRSIAGNLGGVINQRLVRRLCPDCRQPVPMGDDQKRLFNEHRLPIPDQLFVPAGCTACRNTGYLGRIGLFEAAIFTNDVASGIAAGESERTIADLLEKTGMTRLDVDALQKVAEGTTSFDEAHSVHWLEQRKRFQIIRAKQLARVPVDDIKSMP